MCYEDPGSSETGKRLILQLGLNALIDKTCQGCRFHEYPYKFQSVIRGSDKNYHFLEIKNDHDLWQYILNLQLEAQTNKNTKGRGLSNVIIDIFEQLPFFCCVNKIKDKSLQRDVQKYTYCKEANTRPYTGTYGDTPKIWVDKFFILRNLYDKYASRLQQKRQREIKAKNGNNH